MSLTLVKQLRRAYLNVMLVLSTNSHNMNKYRFNPSPIPTAVVTVAATSRLFAASTGIYCYHEPYECYCDCYPEALPASDALCIFMAHMLTVINARLARSWFIPENAGNIIVKALDQARSSPSSTIISDTANCLQ